MRDIETEFEAAITHELRRITPDRGELEGRLPPLPPWDGARASTDSGDSLDSRDLQCDAGAGEDGAGAAEEEEELDDSVLMALGGMAGEAPEEAGGRGQPRHAAGGRGRGGERAAAVGAGGAGARGGAVLGV